MYSMLATIGTAAGLFVGTNIDDMVVLAVLNVSCRADGRPARWQIWAGQYAGTAVLLVISLVAVLGLTLVPDGWIWVLGFIPLLLGVRKLIAAIRAHRSGETVSPAIASGLAGVTGLTIANGGDNIAAYTPVFRTLSTGAIAVTCVVFAAGVALWCLAGAWLVSHHRVTHLIQEWAAPSWTSGAGACCGPRRPNLRPLLRGRPSLLSARLPADRAARHGSAQGGGRADLRITSHVGRLDRDA